MRVRQLWLWALSLVTITLLLFALAYGCLLLLGLAAMAPEVIVWPLITSLVVGLIAAIAGFAIAERKPRKPVAAVVNVLAGIAHAAGLVLLATPVVTATQVRYIVPAGYMGEVVIVHGIGDGGQEKRALSAVITYEIPESGVLVSREHPEKGWIRAKYFYRARDGSLSEIQTVWSTTIHDTPENRADPSVGIYLRTGIGMVTSPSCRFEFHSFVIGNKSYILGDYLRVGQRHEEARRLACEKRTGRDG